MSFCLIRKANLKSKVLISETSGLTKRALDDRDSARLSSSFHPRYFISLLQKRICPTLPPVTQTVSQSHHRPMKLPAAAIQLSPPSTQTPPPTSGTSSTPRSPGYDAQGRGWSVADPPSAGLACVIAAGQRSLHRLRVAQRHLCSARAGPSGLRRPCSQFCKVATLTPII